MAKITTLTPGQKQRLVEFHAEWLAHGLSTAPADRPHAEAAITEMYRLLKRERPRFVWVDSPFAAQLMIHILPACGQVGAILEASLGASLRDSLWDSLWDSLGDSLRDSLGDSLRDSLRASKVPYVYTYLWGQMDAYWVAFYLFCGEIGVPYKVEDRRRLDLWADIAKSAGWWWPFENAVVICERPSVICMEPSRNRQDRLQLHSLSGPAVAFRDGWGVYAVHGVRVPEYVIARPEEITAAEALNQRNAEVRRVMIERMGEERFVSEAKPEILDEDIDGGGQERQLIRIALDGDEPYVAVQVRCPSTGHQHILRVPPDTKTAIQGVAWSYSMEPEDYVTLVEA